jgi:LacI family transcriptional regulator
LSDLTDRKNIYTIAKELKLSPSTISKVLNRTGSVSQKTRERVLDYIATVGYVPASSARKLKSKRSYTLGVVFTEESNIGLEHSFFSSILQHFKTYSEQRGYELSFIVTKLGEHQMSYYEWCLNKRVDGIYIVVGNYQDQGLYDLVGKGIPCVSTDMILPGLHTVISDNEAGIRLVLNYIKRDLKKHDIALIAGPKSSKAFVERVEHFTGIGQQLGLDTSRVTYTESFGFTSGYQAMESILKKHQPEVVLVNSDDLALGAMKCIQDQGLSIPNDIQVIGFDDIAFARHFSPPLTTIRQDRKLLGETAASHLIRMIEDSDHQLPEVTKCPVELIKRESTKEAL